MHPIGEYFEVTGRMFDGLGSLLGVLTVLAIIGVIALIVCGGFGAVWLMHHIHIV